MTDDVKYETRTVHTVRGMEARTQAKWERDGWELGERSDASMFRTKLTFRRVKKQVPVWIWIAGGAVAASLAAGIIVGSSIGDDVEPATAAATPAATEVAASEPTPTRATPAQSAAASPSPTAKPSRATGDPVTRKQVLAAFRSYFAERAAANVMVGKAVTKVSFKGGVVKVTFDPAAVGLSQDSFDEVKGFDNLAKFAATPIAFTDETGNRLRPAIEAIKTVTPDGESLGTYSHADILALNELTE